MIESSLTESQILMSGSAKDLRTQVVFLLDCMMLCLTS